MIKRILLILTVVLPFAIVGQTPVGSWKVYPAYGQATAMTETPHHVYLVSEGCLHSYDKNNDESRSYISGIDISGSRVNDIFYNANGKYLLITFTDGTIDLLYDDGQRAVLPDIRDANINMTKEIYDVAFDGNLIYVATSFGLVVFDESKGVVKESGVYNFGISSVATSDKYVYVMTIGGEFESHLMKIEKGKRINSINNFSSLGYLGERPKKLYTLSDSNSDGSILLAAYSVMDNFYIFDVGSEPQVKVVGRYFGNVTNINPCADGLIVVANGTLNHVSETIEIEKLADLPTPIANDMIACYTGRSSVWASNIDGLGHYRIGDDGALTVLSERYRNPEATTFSDVAKIFPLSNGDGFVISNLGMSALQILPLGDYYDVVFKGNQIEKGKISNIEVGNVSVKGSAGQTQASLNGNHIFSPTCIVRDPDDETKYYIGSGIEGLYVIKDGIEIGHFTDENSNIHKVANWAWRVTDAQIDKDGNLLVGVFTLDTSKPALVVLPADKRRLDPSKITIDDWIGINTGPQIEHRDVDFILCKDYPVIFVHDAKYYSGITVIHFGGSIIDTNDDKCIAITNFTDQDGKIFAPDYVTCFAEDHNGKVWFGTSNGLAEVAHPLDPFKSDFHINRLKVPRNDGTNLADYLLDNEEVLCIAVDASNRKWIGTRNSGLYLVNENGSEILSHFTTENSPLLSNGIAELYVDPNSNSVYIATLNGLYEYSSTSSPALPDYSNVYAYPNPVEPGYSGWITITGLMESSLVKIMDSGMHLVYQTTSEGGMALWDGCNLGGARVKSGVYYVLASTSDDAQSQGDVVAKILVIN